MVDADGSIIGIVRVVLDAIVLLVKTIIAFLIAAYRLVYPIEERSVANDIVLVTGAAQGIGKELAIQYGQLGARVVCVDINGKLNEHSAGELKKMKIRAYPYTCDITKKDEVVKMADWVQAEVGDVTIIVNNAGIMPCKPFLSHSEADIRKVFDVNILAHFWILDAFLPAMREKNFGNVVALSSIAGLEGYPNVVPYNSTKFAVRGLMDGLAEEFRKEGRDIKCTTICPFMVDTGLCQKPIIRFDSLLGMLDPKEVASIIIKAQRQGLREISIPRYVRPFTFFMKLLPVAADEAFHNFMATGLEAHDE